MEKSLDPKLISVALGEHERLPSPERLAELLTKAELGLLYHKPEFSDELRKSGWYLHAIGSSKYALETYGIERQRSAFQVSAHIFDLLLQSQKLSHIERLEYSFASQIAYLRSQLDPNAIAIYGREKSGLRTDSNLVSDYQDISLSCGIALLGMNANFLYQTTDRIRDEINRLISGWGVENIFSTPFGATAGIVNGTRDLFSYLIYGNLQLLERSKELFLRSVQSEASSEDQISRWVASHLLNIADDLKNASIWTVLPPEIPPAIRKAFTMAHPKILTLWPPQIELFSANLAVGVNPLSSEVKRLFLSTPTSGGKTLLAQLLIVAHLATSGKSVCYVAPTRSLCREIANSLDKRLRYLKTKVISGLPEGDWLEGILDTTPQVEVMTPERLSYLIRSDSKKLIDDFGMFIFDEVHTIGERGRGWILEEDLAFLQYATQGKDHKIIFISAAIGNKVQFIEWLGQNGDDVVRLIHDWRGPRRLYATWNTLPDKSSARVEIAPKAKDYSTRRIYALHGQLHTLIPHSGVLFSLQTTEPIGELAWKFDVNDEYVGKDASKSTPFYKMLIPLINDLSLSGPVLVIESTIPRTIQLAKAIAVSREETNRPVIKQLIDLVVTKLHPTHSLGLVLKKGVAYHHGSLSQEVRVAIEEAASQNQIDILVATTTMTEGVNLPVKSVVIASQGTYTANGEYEEYITGPKLVNAIGRAGRATKETEGIVVLALNQQITPDDFKRFTPNPDEMEVISNIATKEALEFLANFEEVVREAEDAIFRTNNQIISNFLSFIWFFASELEKIGSALTDDNLLIALSKTLAWSQLKEEDRGRWFNVAHLVLDNYSRTDPTTRQRWAESGTSLNTARVIENIAREISPQVKNLNQPISVIDAISLILSDARLDTILSLPECKKQKVYFHRTGIEREELILPNRDILIQWVRGEEIIGLAETFFGDIDDVDFRFEQLGNFITNYFENFFPWIISTIVNWTNSVSLNEGEVVQLPKITPACIKWGVERNTALKLMMEGIISRNLANRIAEIWETEKIEIDVHSWIRSMTIDDWRIRFSVTIPEIRNLLEFSRSRLGNIATDVIANETNTIEVDSAVDKLPSNKVLLKIPDSDLSPVEIWMGDQKVGQIRSCDQSDIQTLINSGLLFDYELVIENGKGELTINLVNPG